MKAAKFAPVWTTILKIRAIFVHQTLTRHAIYRDLKLENQIFLITLNRYEHGMCSKIIYSRKGLYTF